MGWTELSLPSLLFAFGAGAVLALMIMEIPQIAAVAFVDRLQGAGR
jgi:hypothetical protein